MRLLHGLLKLLFAAGLIAGGVVLFLYPVSELYALFVANIPANELYRQIVGCALGAVAFLALLPRLPKRRKGKEVSFAGPHGEVTIEIGNVESTLERVVSKLPEVRTISLQVKPLDGPGRVLVTANCILIKHADGDARQITGRVIGYIQNHTRKLLGLREVDVKLKVRRFVVNLKTVKPEPLLLAGPASEASMFDQPPAPANDEPSSASGDAWSKESPARDGESS